MITRPPDGGAVLPPDVSGLLRHSRTLTPPDAAQRIFVNRTLRLESIRHVGFDLDWTLADYRREALSRLTVALTVERLIEQSGYPPEIRSEVEFRPSFPRRGLIVDREAGTVLQMNRHRFVGSAYLGRRAVERGRLAELYRQLVVRPADPRFYHVDTLFEVPEVNVFSELVDLSLRRPELPLPRYPELFQQVRQTVDELHSAGPLKANLLARPERYFERDERLALALQRLALGGRRLFLLSNSEFPYLAGVCSYLFDGLLPGLASWRQLFDLVVSGAGKPGFFRNGSPFVALTPEGGGAGEVERPSWGGIYRGGNLDGLMALLGTSGESVLYVGDHIYSDILSTKRQSTWRTALIVRELEDEIAVRPSVAEDRGRLRSLQSEIAEIGHAMDLLSDQLALEPADGEGDAALRLRGARQRHFRLRQNATEVAGGIAARFNPWWGSIFSQNGTRSLFASQLDAFACLYTARVRNFLHYGTHHYFRVSDEPLAHERDAANAGQRSQNP